MSVFVPDLNDEMLIHMEQLTRLIRDSMHYTCIKQIHPSTEYRTPRYHLDGVYYTAEMEEARKYRIFESRTNFFQFD